MPETAAPQPSHRLIPSRFPPVGLFDTVTRAADLEAVMELAGWTNDRLVAERVARLPRREWVFGRPNSSIVMAAFLHAPPGGTRFAGPDLGAWYAAARIETAVAEVGHHLRREAFARRKPELTRRYRAYSARLDGRYRDIRARVTDMPQVYACDDYAASQAFGEGLRKAGADGIVYDSLRHAGGVNVVAYRPSKVLDVVQAEHLEVTVRRDERQIVVKRLTSEP
ncbi:hypothetical protein VE25_14610 [Devosia geojensis]|uniref:RES domain-containing protein n=1 Tax=Devosia geojensis TaxID=443610 RepID=A0A0F5FS89_9HYPH|nr:RES family NAD+ phosphorylase [Devosia geojensis]KKB11017.1 hypothetical protein VE25_14610 [Devosia geojensis]